MPSLTIRAYQPQDRDGLIALYRIAFPDDPPWNNPQDMIASKLAIQPEGLLVATDKAGQLIATIAAGYDGHRGWINMLAVEPAHRNKGIGRQMMNHALVLLEDMGAAKVNLQIRGDNLKLRDYYASMGFEEEHRISMGILTSKVRERLMPS
jgi:ribosomal protein S18 acetylase RimI-like enzyme